MHNAAFLIKYKLHHLFFWLMLFAVWYFLRYEDYSTEAKAFTVTLIKVADLALMIYITNYLLIPQLLYKKRYVLFALAFIALIITSSIFKMYKFFQRYFICTKNGKYRHGMKVTIYTIQNLRNG